MKTRAFLAVVLGLLALITLPGARAAEETVKVGITLSLSGDLAELGQEQLNGAQMWVDDLNARGELLGREVELIHYDDQSNPDKSAELYQRLITEDEVDLLLGPYSSDITLAAAEVAERHRFPMLATGAAANKIWEQGHQYIFGLETPARDYVLPVLEAMQERERTRIALIYGQSEFTREVARGVREWAPKHGVEVVFDEEYNESQPQFLERLRRMKATHPDIVVGGTYLNDGLELVRQAKAARLAPKGLVLTVAPALRDFGDALGADAEGILGVVQWMPDARIPGSRDFSFRYKRRFGHNAGHHAVFGYAAGQVLEAAVRLAGTLERDKVAEQLRGLKFRSLLGHYRVDDTGKQIGKASYAMQWQNGNRLLVLPEWLADAEIQRIQPWSER